MNVQLKDSRVDNSPISEKRLVDLFETQFSHLIDQDTYPGDIKDLLTNKILQHLNKHSSRFKYIVTITTIHSFGKPSDKHSNNIHDLEIENSIGTSWNSKKDGLFNYQINDSNENMAYLITLLWIAK
ncbi:hypothetical protein TBLA_0C04760 [Henningerozyma blattae CBS 6284]|uniref:Topoisomerase I damage affected protein 2 n=1 Tax=Henningerozyma blattae (strain ATCC 34711 / CBS 6284 / DSM 70876 / NBRC 10599 / NRRL Y-10934 / UCD 77-7) TaxID=1071380 RepID=I2H1M0_HENB6|nr:hypothetical protein TBLA_0C04760 [Tetrapisispora blattae CBS 6284]CCH60272.1 hypothetical protein TBLA_0C04760 [Tetrapisispora blattae CBS 6284]